MLCGEIQDGEIFGELGLGFRISLDDARQVGSGVRSVDGVEDGGDVDGDFAFEFLFGDLLLGVLLEVELATLPWGSA